MQYSFHILDVLDEKCLELISGDLWSDIACSLYCFIIDGISDEPQFVAKYLKHGDKETDNPNLDAYVEFEQNVYQLISESSSPRYPSGEMLSLVKSELGFVTLTPYLEEGKCAYGLLFYLVKVIDRIIGDTKQSIHKFPKFGPLNKKHRESVGFYLKSANQFVDDFLDAHSIKHRLNDGSLNEQLINFFFFRKEGGFELPVILPSRSSVEVLDTTENIKIAVAPIRGSEIPLPDISSRETDIHFEYEGGSAFRCSYSETYGQRYSEQLLAIVKKAVNTGCSMLVLPEFVVTDKMVEMLKCALRQTEDLGNLQLVIAGSWWNPKERHNVGSLIFAESGIIKHFDKYVPYVMDGPNGSYTEILERTEKRTALVYMPGIGFVLPQICRDVVESENRLFNFAKAFRPALIIAPAWSNSIRRGFKNSLGYLTGTFDVVCVIANACGARRASLRDDEKSPVVSLCAFPAIESGEKAHGRQTFPDYERLTADCINKCPSCFECCHGLWVVDVACKNSVDACGASKPAISVTGELCRK